MNRFVILTLNLVGLACLASNCFGQTLVCQKPDLRACSDLVTMTLTECVNPCRPTGLFVNPFTCDDFEQRPNPINIRVSRSHDPTEAGQQGNYYFDISSPEKHCVQRRGCKIDCDPMEQMCKQDESAEWQDENDAADYVDRIPLNPTCILP